MLGQYQLCFFLFKYFLTFPSISRANYCLPNFFFSYSSISGAGSLVVRVPNPLALEEAGNLSRSLGDIQKLSLGGAQRRSSPGNQTKMSNDQSYTRSRSILLTKDKKTEKQAKSEHVWENRTDLPSNQDATS